MKYEDNNLHAGTYTFGEDETFEYVAIPTLITGLDRCVYLDDGFSYKRWNHPLWAIVANGNTNLKENQDMLTISVEEKPQILNTPSVIDIDETNLNNIFSFISKHWKTIKDIANEEYYSYNFIKDLKAKKIISGEYVFGETEEMEYTPIPSSLTNIGCDLYIDDSNSYKMRNHPIWAYIPNGDWTNNEAIIFTVEQSPKIIHKPNEIKAPQTIIDNAIEFIAENYITICDIANEKKRSYDFRKELKK